MMLDGAPALAVKYQGPAVIAIRRLHRQISRLVGYQRRTRPWRIEDKIAGYCVEWSHDQSSTFFDRSHPIVEGVTYYEGVWIRQYLTDPTSVIIYLADVNDPLAESLILTIGNPPNHWVEEVVAAYVKLVEN
jgi:hypothetical protein